VQAAPRAIAISPGRRDRRPFAGVQRRPGPGRTRRESTGGSRGWVVRTGRAGGHRSRRTRSSAVRAGPGRS
jgi:hypothetical protein